MGELRKQNMNTLQDMILDEEKLVTYVSLSKELCIHVNESKILLQQVIETIRQKKLNVALNVNYIISGILDNCLARTVVCMEHELDSLKKMFKSIFFEHVYSVSKGSQQIDNAALLGTAKIEDLILCAGLIKADNCVKRTVNEIVTLKTNSQDIASVKEETIVNQPLKKTKKENEEKLFTESEKKYVADTSVKTNLVKVKIEESSPEKGLNNKLKVNQVTVKQKGIVGFFNKTNAASIKKEKVIEENKSKLKSFESPIKLEDKLDDKVIKVNVKSEVTPDIKTDKSLKDLESSKKTPNGNCMEQTKSQILTKNLKVDKKRKRVCILPQSDSENEDNDPFINDKQMEVQNDSEDEIPPTPTVNTIKITSGITNPKKKRKIVEKTYKVDDGYVLTKKEEVYESCSDNEEEIKTKENVATIVNKVKAEISPKENKGSIKKSKKKASPPQNGKQATMLNFFKRDKK